MKLSWRALWMSKCDLPKRQLLIFVNAVLELDFNLTYIWGESHRLNRIWGHVTTRWDILCRYLLIHFRYQVIMWFTSTSSRSVWESKSTNILSLSNLKQQTLYFPEVRCIKASLSVSDFIPLSFSVFLCLRYSTIIILPHSFIALSRELKFSIAAPGAR